MKTWKLKCHLPDAACAVVTVDVQIHIPRKSRSSVVEMVVSTPLNLTLFTCVLEVVVDPSLHLCDTVLDTEMLPLLLRLERLEGLGE